METQNVSRPHPTAQDAFAHPSARKHRLSCSESEAALLGRLGDWRELETRRVRREQRREMAAVEFQTLRAGLFSLAMDRGLSHRKLARLAGLPESTLRYTTSVQSRLNLRKLRQISARLNAA